jgi:hypothetical protein
VTCTATVTDTTGGLIPTSTVAFTAAPSTGTFSGATCTLQPSGAAGATALCTATFTPTAGGGYTITAAYDGDGNHAGSTDTFSLTAVDPTTTSLSCSASTVSIDSATACTATVTDPTGTQSPLGTVSFSSAPSNGTFGAPGICHWQRSGAGGSATCQVTFTPSAPGFYTLSAGYSGDSDHTASSGSLSLIATTTPAGGGPGSHGGSGTLTIPIPITTGPPPAARLTIGSRAKVSSKHAAALKLSCAGNRGATCAGTLRLTTTVKVKVRIKGKGKRHSKKRKTKTESKTITIGSVRYGLAAGTSGTFAVKLSKTGVKLLAKARHGRLKVKASAANSVTTTVTLMAQTHKMHKRHKKKRKK